MYILPMLIYRHHLRRGRGERLASSGFESSIRNEFEIYQKHFNMGSINATKVDWDKRLLVKTHSTKSLTYSNSSRGSFEPGSLRIVVSKRKVLVW